MRMKNQSSKLRHEEKQETVSGQHQQQQQKEQQFSSVEEAMRHDAANITVPPGIAERLNKSIAAEPKTSPSWWKRIFSK